MKTNSSTPTLTRWTRTASVWVILTFASTMLAVSSQAQTNGPTTPLGADFSKLGSDVIAAFESMKPFTTNGEATAAFGYGMNTASKEQIEALIVTVPTGDITAIGFGGYHIGSEWADANVNLQFGVKKTIPIIGVVRMFAGDGLAYSFKRDEPANIVLTGVQKDWDISPKFHAGIGGIMANTSDRPGVDLIAGAHFTYHW